jgi:hypothetical protein
MEAEGGFVLRVDLAGLRTPENELLPAGYTGISANNGRGIVAVTGADGTDALFDVIDSVGPVISDSESGLAPLVLENPERGEAPDVLFIQFSEPLGTPESGLAGLSTLYFTTEANPGNNPAEGGTPLDVRSVTVDDNVNRVYRVTLAESAAGPVKGDWIRLNPSGALADVVGNKPHANNRWVRLDERATPPEVRDAWYTSNVIETGKGDYAYIKFNKAVNAADWFANGYLAFRWASDADSTLMGADPLKYASADPAGDPNTLRINLSAAFPSSQRAVRTSGILAINIGYNPATGYPMERDVRARDMAKPVLADTAFLRLGALIRDDGDETHPDTLIVDYSEEIPAEHISAARRPVAILSGSGCSPALTLHSTPGFVEKTGYYRVVYTVESPTCGGVVPSTGDRVRINPDAGLADRYANEQDAIGNLTQPLKVVREPKWSIRIKNNPFRGGAGSATVALSPGLRGVDAVEVVSRIMVFDNLGSLAVDTTVRASGKDAAVEWVWSGHNAKGRLVGTGTYLLKALSTATVRGEGGEAVDSYRNNTRRPIGVVRGKK